MKRPHLALVPAYGLAPLARRFPGRVLALLAVAVAALALLYLGARETSLFAVRELEITGAPPGVRADVEEAAKAYVGTSLVALDGDELRRTLAAVPSVRSLRYDRSFPHTLRLRVTPELPVAVARSGGTKWLVSARGRVIGPLETQPGGLPKIHVAKGTALAPGVLVADRGARAALRVIARLPEGFPLPVRAAWEGEGGLVLRVGAETELRLGERRDLGLKLAVAARILRRLSGGERASLGYLDVTVPERPVGADRPQVSG